MFQRQSQRLLRHLEKPAKAKQKSEKRRIACEVRRSRSSFPLARLLS
jgi:hypothetical protein